MKKYSNLLCTSAIVLGIGLCLSIMTSCEGPEGLAGKDGQDANETCKICHSPSVVDAISVQYELAKHSYGEAAFEEAGSTTCGPCHLSEAFKYVVKNNTPVTFRDTATGGRPSKYINEYYVAANAAYGEISCFTCHSSLHTTYDSTDFSPLTTTAAVPLSMWKGTKTVDLQQDGGSSNLCVKCHQPRPFTASSKDGNVLDYASFVTAPGTIFYDSTANATTNKLVPGYRTHTHYGTVGAIYAGVGGIEFSGSASYSNSPHTTLASCSDCHQAAMTGKAGGHTFVAKGNFNGCNVSGCHSTSPITTNSTTKWKTPRTSTQNLIKALAAKLKQGGIEIMNKNPDTEANLWAALGVGNYDGYLNVYDPVNNPNGPTNNTSGQFRNASPSSSWTTAQKAYNSSLPKLTLKNVQMGAIINFQMCLREYSLGIHNGAYTTALLQNSIDALTLAGF